MSLLLLNVYMDNIVRKVHECNGPMERSGTAVCEWWPV